MKMTKKQSKIKKVKKADNSAKTALALKKLNPNKTDKNKKSKSVSPSGGKASKPVPKAVKKKTIAKKAIKPIKKAVIAKASKSLPLGGKIVKAVKPIKKSEKKSVLKPISLAKEKVISKKNAKSENEIAIKTTALVIPIKNYKVTKPAKAEKKEKSGKSKNADTDIEFIKPVKKSKGGRKPKNKNDDDDEPIIENDILIEQLINSTKRLKKPSKVPKQLRTFTNPMASLTVAKLIDTNKKGSSLPKKEPKGKFELEYVMHTSPGILYEFLTSPSGLSEWFADDVNIHEGVFTFYWEGSEQKAKLIGFKEDKFVRLQWLDKPDGTYFEFRIERDELTGDISLIVTDFADEAADLKTSKLLWDSQVNQLLHVIGSY